MSVRAATSASAAFALTAPCARRSNKLVDDLGQVRAASAGLDVAIPSDVVQHFVDEGRPPDEFVARQRERVQQLSDDVRGKQRAMRQLADAVREQGASLCE